MPAPDPTGLHVLLVEDEKDARTLLQVMLSKEGMLPETAESATEALRRLEAGRFDLLITDIAMPGHDGFWLLDQVRRRCDALHELPAVAVSGRASPADRARSIEAGFQAHVSKPVDRSSLLQAIGSALRARRARTGACERRDEEAAPRDDRSAPRAGA